ncbi:hypothetical protein THASP1DRAFT_32088 [Thamnocephalis sphaerospora]|uniref:Integral membrane protein n=1 Tax=Thamnocephalis sphaerospora TaxID=78915 RepID=A0A4P9XJX2_9FUNG|nr:hypothetical protein THASP1DRAFT_32088 [Thamnocephalis sphaerospora]|eukprot:RKP06088.1 hypothetical protein THASP1DRAFT_32088 [Thamnocephalis sphaerospora]
MTVDPEYASALADGLTIPHYVWGKQVDPLGEIDNITYILLAKDQEEMRLRLLGSATQTMSIILVIVIFVSSTLSTAWRVFRQPRSVVNWCTFVQSSSATMAFGFGITMKLSTACNCRWAIWTASLGQAISGICASIVLVWKAYLAYDRDRRFVWAGIILNLPEPLYLYAAWMHSRTTFTPLGGCTMLYPSWLPWARFGMDGPFNVIFSAAFIVVAARQYRKHGSAVWGSLRNEGTIGLLILTFSNIFCLLLTATNFADEYSMMFWGVDWLITNQILIHQHRPMRRSLHESGRARGRNRNARRHDAETLFHPQPMSPSDKFAQWAELNLLQPKSNSPLASVLEAPEPDISDIGHTPAPNTASHLHSTQASTGYW